MNLGSNGKVVARIESTDIADLDLIVSPLRGGTNSPAACDLDTAGFGCRATLGSASSQLSFRTNSAASADPFYVYVHNRNTTSTRRITFTVTIDEEVKLTRGYDINPGQTFKVGEIRRNSADGNP